MSNSDFRLNRRDVLHGASLGLAVIATGGMFATVAHATPDDVRAALAKMTGGAEPKAGRVTLTIAEVAENGATVPYTVKVESPMTEKDYVKAIYIMADGNNAPNVTTYRLTPDCGAEVSGRMRLAKTQSVHAVAQMSDGTCFAAKAEVKVTIGGCG